MAWSWTLFIQYLHIRYSQSSKHNFRYLRERYSCIGIRKRPNASVYGSSNLFQSKKHLANLVANQNQPIKSFRVVFTTRQTKLPITGTPWCSLYLQPKRFNISRVGPPFKSKGNVLMAYESEAALNHLKHALFKLFNRSLYVSYHQFRGM